MSRRRSDIHVGIGQQLEESDIRNMDDVHPRYIEKVCKNIGYIMLCMGMS